MKQSSKKINIKKINITKKNKLSNKINSVKLKGGNLISGINFASPFGSLFNKDYNSKINEPLEFFNKYKSKKFSEICKANEVQLIKFADRFISLMLSNNLNRAALFQYIKQQYSIDKSHTLSQEIIKRLLEKNMLKLDDSQFQYYGYYSQSRPIIYSH